MWLAKLRNTASIKCTLNFKNLIKKEREREYKMSHLSILIIYRSEIWNVLIKCVVKINFMFPFTFLM